MPATPVDVARYLAAHAGCLVRSNARARLVAIGQAHTVRGFPNPTTTDLVRLTMRGIRRTYGVPQRRVAALTTSGHSLNYIPARELPHGPTRSCVAPGGFCWRVSTFRACSDRLQFASLGRTWACDHDSKKQVRSRGPWQGSRHPLRTRPMCPVKALEAWLSASGITDGPVFRSMHKGGRVGPKRLSPDAVAEIVKRRARAAGLDPTYYSGHSLRAGFVTSAAAAGMPTWRIKAQTGHATDAMVSRYIRHAALFDRDSYPAVL